MPEIVRHVGKLKNTGQKCVVVFRKIPDDEEYALIVQSEQLPDRYHDNLMKILNSESGQSTVDFYEVLARNMFGDGGIMLETLHTQNFLQKVPVKDIVLYPMPNHPLPLSEANADIDGDVGQTVENETVPVSEDPNDIPSYDANMIGDDKSLTDLKAAASNKMAQAELLMQDAKRLQEEAYFLDPSLKPQKGRPKLTEEEKERRRKETNRKRREKYKKDKESEKKKEATVNADDVAKSALKEKIDREIQNKEDT